MATFTFKWPHKAEEVYVTGTFDNWTKSEQLERSGDVFQKTVKIPDCPGKVYYKFVVDNEWVTDPEAPQEKDNEGNINNLLLPENMSKPDETAVLNTVTPESDTAQLAGGVPLEHAEGGAAGPTVKAIDTVTPESTTAALAGTVPIEETKAHVTAPGGYPETPAADLDKEVKVDPLPAADGGVNPIKLVPGEKIPDEVTAGGIKDHVTLDKESYEQSDRLPGSAAVAAAATVGEISVNPLPAADGALNPIKLEPGQRIPDDVSAGKIADNVKLDKDSYEQSDRLPGSSVAADLEKEVKVSPLPAAEGALNPIKLKPGDKIPEEISAGNITDNVTLDQGSYERSDRLPGSGDAADLGKEVKVNPLPATEGALNPIKLAPGEKIPEGVTTGSITDNVTLDKESYEKSDRLPGLEAQLPPVTGNMIPESSLPILGAGDVTINTVTPESTTAALAGRVPVEPAAPEMAKKSLEEAKPDLGAGNVETKGKSTGHEAPVQNASEAPSTAGGIADAALSKSDPAAGGNAGVAASPAATEHKKAAEAEPLKKTEVKPSPVETNGATAAAPSPVAPVVSGTIPTPATETTEATKTANGAPSAEKKKKNRLSAMFSKLKHKVSGDRK